MIRNVRKKLAASISEITSEEDFLYNTWLRAVPNKEISVGSIAASMFDTSKIVLSIEEPFATEHFAALNNSTVYPEDETHLFEKTGTNPVFFALLYVPSKIITHKEFDPAPVGDTAINIDFLLPQLAQKDIAVKFKMLKPTGYMFKFKDPEIKDYLANLQTKIHTIELLNLDELLADYNVASIQSINVKSFGKLKVKKLKVDKIRKTPKLYKLNVPSIGKFKTKISSMKIQALGSIKISKTVNLVISEPSIASGKYGINSPASAKYYDVTDPDLANESGKKIKAFAEPQKTKDVIKLLLKNSYKVDWGKRKDFSIALTKSEEANSKFLAENDRALLSKELGMGKIKESLAALRFLFLNKVIQSSLIIVPNETFGIERDENHYHLSKGWIKQLRQYCPEFTYSVITGNDDERLNAWNKSAFIYVTDYNTAIKDFHLKILEGGRLAKIDCVVMDEVQNIFNEDVERGELLKSIGSKIFWALSSIIDDHLVEQINSELSSRIVLEKRKVQKYSEVLDERSGLKYKEYWLEQDEHQQVEYKETISDCRKELRKVLESENPLRFQSNIFTLLHKLYQVENFAHGHDESPKSKLLLQHLEIFKRNGKKVIIISQYDRQGTKKIERLLDVFKISYTTAPASLSADEMQKTIKIFKEKESITAFLTNAKEVRLNFGDYVVPYIIKFDTWWNPTLIWQLTDLFKIDDDELHKKNINVFSYKMLNSVDAEVKSILTRKHMFEKNIVSVIPTNTMNELISVDEWLEIFEMDIEDPAAKAQASYEEILVKLKSLTIADYRATLSKFFFAIGYTNLDILADLNSASFDISGEGKAGNKTVQLFARIVLEKTITAEKVNEIITNTLQAMNSNTFIITRGDFEEGCEKYARENVTLISQEKLAMYLVNLNLVPHSQTETSIEDTEIPWRED
ncbi:MAG: hypothetical protein JSW63_10125 [Ignavibacterium sp.]|nr:MAG: hypothetical protein JSW63_10125 [Ignavibacterium sp.]